MGESYKRLCAPPPRAQLLQNSCGGGVQLWTAAHQLKCIQIAAFNLVRVQHSTQGAETNLGEFMTVTISPLLAALLVDAGPLHLTLSHR
jgi:hypothetical protein